MKIEKIEISLKEKYFIKLLPTQSETEKLKKEKDEFLKNNKKFIELLEDMEVTNLEYDAKKPENGKGHYSGYYIQYYEGKMQINGKNVEIKIQLTQEIMNLVAKLAGNKIKELVKKEYQEFENELHKLIDEKEKEHQKFENKLYKLIDEKIIDTKNVFSYFNQDKLKKLKQTILDKLK